MLPVLGHSFLKKKTQNEYSELHPSMARMNALLCAAFLWLL